VTCSRHSSLNSNLRYANGNTGDPLHSLQNGKTRIQAGKRLVRRRESETRLWSAVLATQAVLWKRDRMVWVDALLLGSRSASPVVCVNRYRAHPPAGNDWVVVPPAQSSVSIATVLSPPAGNDWVVVTQPNQKKYL